MLAQNFKTPMALDIQDWEFEALLKVLGMLERGELRHVEPGCSISSYQFSGQFNMALWVADNDCGTVACIGGTASLIAGRKIRSRETPGLCGLFYPCLKTDWAKITTEQAAIAVRNYLTHGEARWAEVMS